MTENYVIMPMGSLVLDAPSLLQGLINMDSLVDVSYWSSDLQWPYVTLLDVTLLNVTLFHFQAMEFDTNRNTVFKIFNKKTREWERKEFVADPVMIIHTINAFEDEKGNIKDLF